jgi:hypothetical protein
MHRKDLNQDENEIKLNLPSPDKFIFVERYIGRNGESLTTNKNAQNNV